MTIVDEQNYIKSLQTKSKESENRSYRVPTAEEDGEGKKTTNVIEEARELKIKEMKANIKK